MPRNRGWTRGLVVALAVVAGAPASASVALGLSIGALTRRSDLVVLARVTRVTSRPARPGGGLHTYTTLAVIRTLAGTAPASVVVRQLGGRRGRRVSRVVGDARFRAGEEVVVFLRRDPRAPVYHLTALAEAKFTVVRGSGPPAAVRDLSGLDLLGPGGRPVAVPARMALSDLLARISRARSGAGGRRAVP